MSLCFGTRNEVLVQTAQTIQAGVSMYVPLPKANFSKLHQVNPNYCSYLIFITLEMMLVTAHLLDVHWLPIPCALQIMAKIKGLGNRFFAGWILKLLFLSEELFFYPTVRKTTINSNCSRGTIPILRQQRNWVGGVRKMAIFAYLQYHLCWRWVGQKKIKNVLT